ncbi:NADH-quinone oxidoreductase subunit A [Candidatus Bathyarchaeota archaeon]|nr:NADH-quinone oxidoreductase subunit A [Candidatus Bathyarchaeota archaeon]
MEEFTIALIIVSALSISLYASSAILSRRLNKNIRKGLNGKSPYACGEKVASLNSRINVSLYKYLIYFVMFDSSLIIIAFASLALHALNIWFFVLYVLIIFISSLFLLEGEK